MAKVGDKYIIEISERYETVEDWDVPNEEQNNAPCMLYRIKGFNSLVFDETGLNKLEKYEEQEKYDAEAEYQRGLNDAWACANKIQQLSGEERFKIIGSESPIIDFSTNYCIEKLKAYEEQKNAEEEDFKVGDEVYLVDRNHPRVVTCIFTENGCHTKAVQITENGKYVIDEIRNLQKTGRHFSGIAEVLKQLREKEKDDGIRTTNRGN